MKISNKVNTKIKVLLAVTAMAMLFPTNVFANCAGGSLDSNGNWNINLGLGSGTTCNSGGGGIMPWSLTNPFGLPGGTILGIVTSLLSWLLAIFAVVGIIGFVISGIIYLVSAGSESVISRAKDAMKWSIVGIIVGLSGFLLIQAVNSLLNASTNF